MLFFVLILVLAALGLLVTALITANSLWAWVSIGLSVVAGLLLVVDYFRRRARRKRAAQAAATIVEAEPVAGPVAEGDEAADAKPASEEPEAAATGEGGEADEPAVPAANGDPAEEKTSPADAEVVAQLDNEVVVVDEHPRYHLTDCEWLGERATIPIAVKEARDLGFSPCGRCTPDAKLAQAHRAAAH